MHFLVEHSLKNFLLADLEFYTYIHVHTHIYTHRHLYTCAHLPKFTNPNLYKHTQLHKHAHTPIQMCTSFTHTDPHLRTDTWIHICTLTSMSIHATHPHTNPLYTAHTCSHPYVQHPCLHSPLHIYTLTVLRTRRQPCTYTHPQPHTNPYLDTQAHMAIDHT